MAFHENLTESDGIHIPFAWIWVDSTARLAEVVTSDDINKIGLQQDTNVIYVLTTTGPTWVAVGVATLVDLTDVSITPPVTDNHVLTYNLGGNYWEPQPIPAQALEDLSDTNITPPVTNGHVLTYNLGGGYWEPQAGAAPSDHTVSDAVTNVPSTAVTLKHNTSGTPAAGFGTDIEIQADDDTTPDQVIGKIGFAWQNAATASRSSRISLRNIVDGSEHIGMIIEPPANLGVSGNTRGVGAVDLQQYRAAASDVASGDYSTILGGKNNANDGDLGTILNGYNNDIGSGGLYNTILGGYYNQIAASVLYGTILGGYGGYISEDDGVILNGSSVLVDRRGQIAASQIQNADSTSQHNVSMVVGRTVTHSDANWYELTLNNTIISPQRITIPTDTALLFEIELIGITSGAAKTFGFIINGIIENDGGTTSMLASNVTTIYDADDVSFDARVTADNTNDALLVEVQDTDATGDTVRWLASVRSTELGYA